MEDKIIDEKEMKMSILEKLQNYADMLQWEKGLIEHILQSVVDAEGSERYSRIMDELYDVRDLIDDYQSVSKVIILDVDKNE